MMAFELMIIAIVGITVKIEKEELMMVPMLVVTAAVEVIVAEKEEHVMPGEEKGHTTHITAVNGPIVVRSTPALHSPKKTSTKKSTKYLTECSK